MAIEFQVPQVLIWAGAGGITVAGWIFSTVAKKLLETLDALVTEVKALNTKMAVVVERVDNHDRRIDRLEIRK